MTRRRINIANRIHCIKPEGKKLFDPKKALAARPPTLFDFVVDNATVFGALVVFAFATVFGTVVVLATFGFALLE